MKLCTLKYPQSVISIIPLTGRLFYCLCKLISSYTGSRDVLRDLCMLWAHFVPHLCSTRRQRFLAHHFAKDFWCHLCGRRLQLGLSAWGFSSSQASQPRNIGNGWGQATEQLCVYSVSLGGSSCEFQIPSAEGKCLVHCAILDFFTVPHSAILSPPRRLPHLTLHPPAGLKHDHHHDRDVLVLPGIPRLRAVTS